ncbi:MAG TPA: fasciclin domain-containing protein, partial [Geminicoccaceae bacterium]|nr:fasciclin domain-containing protein [Geminicoccaceae bacterium]
MLRTIRLLKAVPMALPLCLAIGAATTVRAADLVETMRADGRFGNLVRAIEAAELADALRGPGPFTVFAPTDEAFAARPEGERRDLLGGDPERLRTLLRHHVVEGRLPSNDLPPELPSLAGEPLAVAFGAGGLTVADGDQRATVVA